MWAAVWAQVVTWFGKIGAKVTALGAVLVSLLYIHHSAKRKAAKDAVKQERQRITIATNVKKEMIREQADEIDQDIAGADSDDLRERMRKQATDTDHR